MVAAFHSCLISGCSGNVGQDPGAYLHCIASHKFHKTKDWLNPHNDKNKVPQNLENKLTIRLHFSKAYLSWIICQGGDYFQESLFH